MLNLQILFDNAVAKARAERMKTSLQLTLGELILKLKTVKNKDVPIVFDTKKYSPTGLDSWRGVYDELAIGFKKDGKCTVKKLLQRCKECIGETLSGYKGGDYLMGKTTPVWVANYGDSVGFKTNENHNGLAVVDIVEKEKQVVIKTLLMG